MLRNVKLINGFLSQVNNTEHFFITQRENEQEIKSADYLGDRVKPQSSKSFVN